MVPLGDEGAIAMGDVDCLIGDSSAVVAPVSFFFTAAVLLTA